MTIVISKAEASARQSASNCVMHFEKHLFCSTGFGDDQNLGVKTLKQVKTDKLI